ncbi:19361_t:CDS:2, partial [Gigaspora margarita]
KMAEEFHGYAAFDKEGILKPYSYTPKPLGDEDIEVEISHSIVGHEIVGKVLKKGSKVTDFNIGDRVGI